VLLDRMDLTEKADSYVAKLSGGQRQRAFIGLALINDPDLVFLDELTTGLDPQARLAMWDVIRDIRGEGKTVFLTTHFMDEAERLCDRVAIMDHGKIVALGTVDALITSIGTQWPGAKPMTSVPVEDPPYGEPLAQVTRDGWVGGAGTAIL
jgi:ABC-2 type transport system ATP-binding protein